MHGSELKHPYLSSHFRESEEKFLKTVPEDLWWQKVFFIYLSWTKKKNCGSIYTIEMLKVSLASHPNFVPN